MRCYTFVAVVGCSIHYICDVCFYGETDSLAIIFFTNDLECIVTRLSYPCTGDKIGFVKLDRTCTGNERSYAGCTVIYSAFLNVVRNDCLNRKINCLTVSADTDDFKCIITRLGYQCTGGKIIFVKLDRTCTDNVRCYTTFVAVVGCSILYICDICFYGKFYSFFITADALDHKLILARCCYGITIAINHVLVCKFNRKCAINHGCYSGYTGIFSIRVDVVHSRNRKIDIIIMSSKTSNGKHMLTYLVDRCLAYVVNWVTVEINSGIVRHKIAAKTVGLTVTAAALCMLDLDGRSDVERNRCRTSGYIQGNGMLAGCGNLTAVIFSAVKCHCSLIGYRYSEGVIYSSLLNTIDHEIYDKADALIILCECMSAGHATRIRAGGDELAVERHLSVKHKLYASIVYSAVLNACNCGCFLLLGCRCGKCDHRKSRRKNHDEASYV